MATVEKTQARGGRPPLAWKRYAAASDVAFFGEFCREHFIQSIDEWDGKPLVLEPWQRRMMGEALAVDENGLPIWRSVVFCIPRKNGKTQLLAAYALFTLYWAEGSPEILLAASSDKQAGRLFDAAAAFVRRDPELSRVFRVREHAGEIVREDGRGSILRMASDPGKLHGYNPSLVVCDELAQWTTPTLRRAYAALTSGGGARQAPQVFTITTAGEASERDDSILGRILDGAFAAEDFERHPGLFIGRLPESQMLVYNFEAPTSDPRNVDAMKLANPASWISKEYLRKQAANPELTDGEVLQLHGCVWAAGAGAWLSPDQWQACREPGVEIPEGSAICLGVDIGLVHDSSAITCSWVREDGKTVQQTHVWSAKRDTLSHTFVPGGVVELELIENHIRELGQRYSISEIGYDPRFFERSAQMLSDEGFYCVPVVQSSAPMADAYEGWYTAVLEGRLVHGGDKVVDSHVSSCMAEKTDRGWKIRKAKQSKRIDAVPASAVSHYIAQSAVADWGVMVI